MVEAVSRVEDGPRVAASVEDAREHQALRDVLVEAVVEAVGGGRPRHRAL